MLQKEVKEFYFSQGLNTKVAGEATPLGSLHLLQNARMDRVGEIQKKYGTTALSTSVIHSPITTLPALKKVFAHDDSLIGVALNPHSAVTRLPPDVLFKYSSSIGKWLSIAAAAGSIGYSSGGSVSVIGTSTSLDQQASQGAGFSNPRQILSSDTASFGNYVCVVQELRDSVGNIYASLKLIDTSIDAVVLQESLLVAPGSGKIIAFNSKFYYFSSGPGAPASITAVEIDPSTLTFATTTTPVTDANFADTERIFFDVVANATHVFIAYRFSATEIKVKKLSSINPVTVSTTITSANVPTRHISMFVSSTHVGVLVSGTGAGPGTGLIAMSFDLNLTAVTAPFLAHATVPEAAYATDFGISSNHLVVASLGTTLPNYNVMSMLWNPASGTPTLASSGLEKYYCLASRPFGYNGRFNFYAHYRNDNDQNTLFLFRLETDNGTPTWMPLPLLRAFYGESIPPQFLTVGTYPYQVLPRVVSYAGDTSMMVAPFVKLVSQPQSGFANAYYSSRLLKASFADLLGYGNTESADSQMIVGGVMGLYDGVDFVEDGFLLAPEPPTLVQSAGGSLTALGTYQYVAVYEWTDSTGKMHRSAPSLPSSITLTGGNQRVTVSLQTSQALPPTWKSGVNVRFYRTETLGTLFYSIIDQPVYGATWLDTAADTAIRSNQLLYTTGGVLENNTLDRVRMVTVFKNRVFALCDDGIFYSKKFEEGRPTEFSLLFNIPIESSGGAVTAIAALRDKFIIFKKDRIYYVTGEGPDDTGIGQLFSVPQALDYMGGCFAPTSVAELGDAVMFKSRTEFLLLTADLQVVAIGSDADFFLNESTTVYGVQLVTRDMEVRFQLSDKMLIYNQFTKQWSVNPTYNNLSVCLAKNDVILVNSSGAPYKEDKTTWKDGSSFVELRAMTGWINLEMIQGYQRVWRMSLLCRFYSNHTLKVNVYYDYLPKIVDTFSFVADSSNLAAFSDSNLFSASPYAGSGVAYRFRMKPQVQKCSAIRFEIYDESQAGLGQSLDLVGIQLELGVKGMSPKLPAAQSV